MDDLTVGDLRRELAWLDETAYVRVLIFDPVEGSTVGRATRCNADMLGAFLNVIADASGEERTPGLAASQQEREEGQ